MPRNLCAPSEVGIQVQSLPVLLDGLIIFPRVIVGLPENPVGDEGKGIQFQRSFALRDGFIQLSNLI